ncbi:ATP-binding protein [Candidatus Chlorohelix sp.]|uniref:ATP-binding protein n=1 Tax=Candidatus Chlorohelix sp. TaxID=3139201 RepID=UPI0030316CE1
MINSSKPTTQLDFLSLQALVMHAPIGMIATGGSSHKVLVGNERYFNIIYWRTPEQIIGHTIAEIYDYHSGTESIVEALDYVYQTKEPLVFRDLSYNIPQHSQDPNPLYLSIHIFPYASPDNLEQIAGLTLYFFDTTNEVQSRKHSQDTASADYERAREFEIIFNNIKDGVMLSDLNRNIIWMNPEAYRLMGVDRDYIARDPGLDDRRLIPYGLDGQYLDHYDLPAPRARLEKRTVEGALIWQRSDGSKVALNMVSVPIINNDGQVSMVVSVFRDIGPRIEAERIQKELLQNLEMERSRLDAIVNDIREGILVIRIDGNIILISRRLANRISRSSIDFVGKSFERIVDEYEALINNVESFRLWVKKVMSAPEKNHEFEISMREPFGVELKLITFPIYDARQEVMAWGLLIENITAQKRAQNLRSQFVATASHELRTPMTGIVGFAELLLNRDVKPELRSKWIGNIYQESMRVSKIIDSMLNISKIEAGALELNRNQFNLYSLLQSVIELVLSSHDGREIKVNLNNIKASETNIHADKEKLGDALNRLISNALKFSDKSKSVEISVSCLLGDYFENSANLPKPSLSSVTQSAWFMVAIRDFGIGIDEEDLPGIFEPFYRTKNPPEIVQRGSGLGLALTKKLIELHNGHLWVNSKPCVGSTFFIMLPSLH